MPEHRLTETRTSPQGETNAPSVTDAAADWFFRFQAAADQSERAALQQGFDAWLAEDPRHSQAFDRIAALWEAPALEGALRLRQAELSKPVPLFNTRRAKRALVPLGMAACLAAGLVLKLEDIRIYWLADYQTAEGATGQITLPDGSAMTLNSGSAVSVDFDQGRREVAVIKGEAYFDVTHDEDHPFKVTGHFARVTVHGTAFSVDTTEDSDDVVLERGHISVERLADIGDNVSLVAGQAVTATATALTDVRETDAGLALSWREGRLFFDDQPLEVVAKELDRYIPGNIVVPMERVRKFHISGSYLISDMDNALQTLADAAGVGLWRLPGGLIILQ